VEPECERFDGKQQKPERFNPLFRDGFDFDVCVSYVCSFSVDQRDCLSAYICIESSVSVSSDAVCVSIGSDKVCDCVGPIFVRNYVCLSCIVIIGVCVCTNNVGQCFSPVSIGDIIRVNRFRHRRCLGEFVRSRDVGQLGECVGHPVGVGDYRAIFDDCTLRDSACCDWLCAAIRGGEQYGKPLLVGLLFGGAFFTTVGDGDTHFFELFSPYTIGDGVSNCVGAGATIGIESPFFDRVIFELRKLSRHGHCDWLTV
jgi:hypothetical protein